MNSESERNNLSIRVVELEKFKHDIEKKLYAAIAVATVLGISVIMSGAWITSLTKDIAKLTKDTSELESKISDWNEKSEETLNKIESIGNNTINLIEKTSIAKLEILEAESEKIVNLNLDDIAQLIEEKKSEVSNIGVDTIINELNSGDRSLNVKSVAIKNDKGNTALYIGVDNGGDGFFRLNSDAGELRYILSLSGNRPAQDFYNNFGKRALSIGVYSDDDIGFAIFRDRDGDKTLLELKSNKNGGQIWSYSVTGEQIVYLGSDRNTGSGLVNVMGIHGEKTNSHAPKK